MQCKTAVILAVFLVAGQCFAREITKGFGTFSVPDTFVETKKFSTPDKPFYVSQEDEAALASGKFKFVNNISVSKGKNKYTKENHFEFRQAILRQLAFQCSVSGFSISGGGYHSKSGYVVYKFVLSPCEELLKKRPQEPTTTQYYIVSEDYSYVLVHETARGDAADTDAAADMIVETFCTQ